MTLLRGNVGYIGIGSNQHAPLARCNEALRLIEEIKDIKIIRSSSFYRTEPVGVLDQEWFINAVVEIRSFLPPRVLLDELLSIELKMGRERKIKWGPRIIDLDILLFGQEIIEEENLVIPHPELHKRRFVIEPLYEIASYVVHPAFGISIAGLRDRLNDQSRVERIKEGEGVAWL